jgi:hypothetical protein
MVAVRGPVLIVLAYEHDRIEKASHLLDDVHQPLYVRFGRIALVRRGLDAVDGQGNEQHAGAAERIAVAAEHRAAVGVDLPRHVAGARVI